MEQDRAQSEFNMDVSYLNRLNNLFNSANECSVNMDVYTWFQILQAAYRELSPEMKQAELDEWGSAVSGKISMINDQILKETKLLKKGVSKQLHSQLHDFEIFLRRILKKAGLQGKKQEDARSALQ